MESLAYLVKETILEPIGHGNLLRSSNQGHIHRQTIWLKWEEIFEENVCEEHFAKNIYHINDCKARFPVLGNVIL